MQHTTLIGFIFLTFSGLAFAQGAETQCTYGDMVRRVKFLQRCAKGHRHPNGGGFVSENARVAASAYVGPNAMVLDGATVKDNACIKEFAVVIDVPARDPGVAFEVGFQEITRP